MGYPRSDGESNYLSAQIGNRWQRLLSNGQIFNWFADFAAQESKIDREKLVKRLRVFSSRDEKPTAFWLVLMNRFYEEGGHLGLRKYVEDGVTFHCPPQYFVEFKAVCQSAPSYGHTLSWVFRPDYLSGWIFAHIFSPGKEDHYDSSWPDALNLRGERHLVSYYRAGTVHELSDGDEEDSEACLEGYRHTHSLLCMVFEKKSSAAYDLPLGKYASEAILEVIADPYLGVSSTGFNDAALQMAALCVQGRGGLEDSLFRTAVIGVLGKLKADYPQLESGMMDDADYMYSMTYPLMPLSKKGRYASVMADFEAAMKTVVIEHAEEITTFARGMTGEDHSLSLHVDREVSEDRERYPIEAVRHYLANSRTPQSMPLEGFDAVLDTSEQIREEPGESVYVWSLKDIVRRRSGRLTDLIEATGEFLVTEPMMVALHEVGQTSNPSKDTSYGELIYRTDSERPWLIVPVKFSGGTDDLEDAQSEFLAFCRITTGK